MNRRGFFKILAGVAIAPFALPEVKIKSKMKRIPILNKKFPWKNYYITYHYDTIEHRQLRERLRKVFDEYSILKNHDETTTPNRS